MLYGLDTPNNTSDAGRWWESGNGFFSQILLQELIGERGMYISSHAIWIPRVQRKVGLFAWLVAWGGSEFVRKAMDDVGHNEGGIVKLNSPEGEEKSKGMESGTPLATMWVIWKERNRRAVEGVEQVFVSLQSGLLCLLSSFFLLYLRGPYWYRGLVSFVENHILV
ncbi:hypothetical protein H5410_062851 [Solanum commersonii]|uniref:Reverse transcriptase zinc-binding domain-containing protein n=1 Tax=Solanum commersonii TaxID=4109 RepID=A0A9J5WC41_SOLCO|nr:hypothetical protein H5410_062851 [Solanum commersonii]